MPSQPRSSRLIPRLGEAGIHAEQLGREETCFIATGPPAHLEDHVAIVMRIAGHEQLAQRSLERGNLARQPLEVVGCKRGHFRIVAIGELARVGELPPCP